MAGSQRGEARLARRARMILLAADGASVSAVAAACGTSRARARDWLRRFDEERLAAVTDQARSGRPLAITPLARHQLVALACDDPRAHGFDRSLWSHHALAECMRIKGYAPAICARSVGLILSAAEIKPHRVKMWCHSRDPDFQAKMRAIVDLYVAPPVGEPVVCVDEKSGIQALSRSRPLKRSAHGPGRHEFDYVRHGTRCLFACFNIRTGKVLGQCTAQRTRADFFTFMDQVAATYRQPRVHVVLDNLNTHHDTTKRADVSNWNDRHGQRFVFHYTPTKGSWLNQVELWFSLLSRRILRYGSFGSVAELAATIETFIATWNETEAHPFRWTYEGLPLVS